MAVEDHGGKPLVALTLGDPAGIGPELIAKLLAHEGAREANVILIGDHWLWQQAQTLTGHQVHTVEVRSFAEVRGRANSEIPAFLPIDTVSPEQVHCGLAEAPGGASVLNILNLCMDAAIAGEIDAICFAPLNKHAMKLAGLRHEDELHHFAEYLGVQNYFCEFNTLGDLWTSRISSHVPLKDVTRYLSKDRIQSAAALLYRSLVAGGVSKPRVAVAALNPHGGDGGTCGREEIDVIVPAVTSLREEGLPIDGPFPADTIFLKARDGEYDGIVTMYHDQGQIAIKLLGFSRGVTVQGGLPIPITTPAHGTAYDIAGRNIADVSATLNAFRIACRMGTSLRQGDTHSEGTQS